MTKTAAAVMVPSGIVVALWFGGVGMNFFGGWIDGLGARLCRFAWIAGPLVLVPTIGFLFFPQALRMTLTERQLVLWISVATLADMALRWYFPMSGWRMLFLK